MAGHKRQNEFAIIRPVDGAKISSVYFKTNKPYVRIECGKDRLILTGVDAPEGKSFCVKAPDKNMRVRLPEEVKAFFDESFLNEKHPVEREKNRTVIHVKSVKDDAFELPVGCSHTEKSASIDADEFEKIATVASGDLNGKIKSILKNSGVEYAVMTVVIDDDRSYILVEPLFNTFACEYKTQDELKGYFGTFFQMFPKGTLRMVIDTKKFNIPNCFFLFNGMRNYAGDSKVSIYSDGTSFLITPKDENCIIDGAKLKASEFRGKEVHLCEKCSAAESKEIIKKLLDSVDELIEENDFLRQQFNEAYEGKAKKESTQNLTAIEKLLVNVDELLGENRRLKGLSKSKNIIS